MGRLVIGCGGLCRSGEQKRASWIQSLNLRHGLLEAEVGVGEVGEAGPGRGRGRGGCLPSRLGGCVAGAVRGADPQPTGWVLGVVLRTVPLL